MGILNVTPDSFSDGGKYGDPEHAQRRAFELVEAGADVLDIGGESTRPGAERLSVEEELGRVLPVLESVRGRLPVPISIDTTKAAVAREALNAGAALINDISGLRFDPEMASVAAEFDVPVIVMHLRGTPKTMQKNPQYKNLMGEILNELAESRARAQQAGISPEKIIVDPGIGFGKQWFHNYQILGELAALKMLESPILIGPSRKSFLGKILNSSPDERLEGTLVASTIGILNGAHLIRVHDVKEARRAARIADMFAGKFRSQ
ncbi:MAG: dihydropteroate synthase [Calditrichaeota bacterium]|nr:dihydropteroate synthase [Calditrichota bacterium]